MKKNPLAQKVLGRQAELPLIDSIPVLEQWFSTSMGQEFLRQQRAAIDGMLPTLFGYHLMQLSVMRDLRLWDSSKIHHRFALSPVAGEGIGALYEDGRLPLESDSVDVVIGHHILDYSQSPHQLLKELCRVVLPSGYILIVGFNPLSMVGLYSVIARFAGSSVWHNHALSTKRLVDWMTLMDFSVQKVEYGFYQPPFGALSEHRLSTCFNQHMLKSQSPFGGFYAILAKKEVAPLTPRRPKWQIRGGSIIPTMEPSMYTPPKNKKQNG